MINLRTIYKMSILFIISLNVHLLSVLVFVLGMWMYHILVDFIQDTTLEEVLQS